ncbi:hypothetical protein KXW56_006591, partial [Aspergillus fumigatus]
SRDLRFATEQELSDDWESSRAKAAYGADDMLKARRGRVAESLGELWAGFHIS